MEFTRNTGFLELVAPGRLPGIELVGLFGRGDIHTTTKHRIN
jgi:hypothetical protein